MEQLSETEMDTVSGGGKILDAVKGFSLIGYALDFLEGVWDGAKESYHPQPRPEQQAK